MKVLVTGAAGFIGYFVARRLLDAGHQVAGIDNLSPYYDPQLKRDRLARLATYDEFSFERVDLGDAQATADCFAANDFNRVVHLAAQAGVAYSLENPMAYVDSNLVGFAHLLESCRRTGIKHLVYASTSSVYGANARLPFSTGDSTDHPLSLYAATKKANEAMAHAYAHLHGVPATGLRFFTVYGPWGRPDMAAFLFTRQILAGEPIELFNHGNHWRDWTYVEDTAEGVVRALMKPPEGDESWSGEEPNPATSRAPYRVYNVGAGRPVHLLEFVGILEELLGRKAKRLLLPRRPVDVRETCADVEGLRRDVGYEPSTSVREGLARFVEWYRDYYRV